MDTTAIICNETQLRIRTNLYVALQHLVSCAAAPL